jgi:hypothetical protein
VSLTKFKYAGSSSELYKTNLYGGSDADLDNTAPVDATDGFTSNIDLTADIFANIEFKFDSSGTTDDLILKLFRALTSTHDVDEIAIDEITVPSDGSEDLFSYALGQAHGPGNYRFSMQSSGGTDTFDIHVQTRLSHFETV